MIGIADEICRRFAVPAVLGLVSIVAVGVLGLSAMGIAWGKGPYVLRRVSKKDGT